MLEVFKNLKNNEQELIKNWSEHIHVDKNTGDITCDVVPSYGKDFFFDNDEENGEVEEDAKTSSENVLPIALKVASKTIGSDLAAVKPESLNIPPEPEINDDEELSLAFPLNGGQPHWNVRKKPIIEEVDYSRITDEDWKILYEHNVAEDKKFHETLEVDIYNGKLRIRTSWTSWAALAGREWQYDFETKEYKLTAMN